MTLADLSPVANHLWQSTLCVAVAWPLTLTLRRNRAAVRYCVWLAASAKFLIPFSWLTAAGSRIAWRPASAMAQPDFSLAIEEIGRPFATPLHAAPLAGATPDASAFPEILLAVWLCGLAFACLNWVRMWRRMRAVRRAATLMDFDLPVPVMSSATRLEPGVFGIRKPVLLLPEGIAERLTPQQLDAVLTHEMCHVRRRDNLTAAIHLVAGSIFWFHPLMWWIRERLVEERERACDEEVLRVVSEPEIYAQGILNVCKFYLASPLATVSGVTGADLKLRIEAILADRAADGLNFSRKLLLVGAAVAAVAGPVALGVLYAPPSHAQTKTGLAALAGPIAAQRGEATAPVAFEVASVKINKSGTNQGSFEISPGGQSLAVRNMAIASLTMKAYGVYQPQLTGSPQALALMREPAVHYDIDAKAAHAVPKREMMRMLQTLLADRFHLTLHRETKEVSGFALVADADGPKLREHAPDESECSVRRVADGSIKFQNCPLESLAGNLLYGVLDSHFVENQTGLKGSYDFGLSFSQELPANPTEGRPEARVWNPDAPSIFTAVKQQLGLRLLPRKITIEMTSVDHVEKPMEN